MGWRKILENRGLSWMLSDRQQRINWKNNKRESVKEWLVLNVDMAFQQKIPKYKGADNDAKMLSIQKWVIKNFRYRTDDSVWRTPEYWQNVDESLDKMTGDCEDGAALMYAIARCNNISPAQLRFCCGWVKWRGGKVGHAWLEYRSDIKNKWQVCDWCWYPDKRDFSLKREAMTGPYVSYWFKVNDWL